MDVLKLFNFSFRSFRVNRSVGFGRIAYSAVVPTSQTQASPKASPRRGVGTKAGCLAVVCLLWSGALALRAADYYVATNGAGGDYKSWEQAASNIQWAVNVATNGETVWVSNGVYALTNQISITNGIILRSTNGPAVTIINGNFTPGNLETNRCLLMSNASAFVHGFTISNGAFVPKVDYDGGAGVYIYSGTLSNCTVRNNTVFMPPATKTDSGGGGVYMTAGTVTACRVTDNIVTNNGTFYGGGGGICAYAANANTAVSDCLISNNVNYGNIGAASDSGSEGGGIVFPYSGTIRSSMICSNRAKTAGGILMNVDCIMNSCTVTLNQATYAGGCKLKGGTVSNCLISYNEQTQSDMGSSGYAYAGGISFHPRYNYKPGRVFNTTIIGNTKYGVNMGVGTILGTNLMANCIIRDNQNGGVLIWPGPPINTLSNCEVSGNSGPGVKCTSGIIRNCLIAGNSNNAAGGGLLISSGCQTALISCCTIASNWSSSAGSGLRIEATNAASARLISISSCIISSNGVSGADDVYDACAPTNYGALQYSCIGSNRGFTGEGNITNQQPQFVNLAGGNYRLGAGSPCINTGSNEPSWMTNSYDLDGRTRIRYGTVDMGAYERINEGTIYKLW